MGSAGDVSRHWRGGSGCGAEEKDERGGGRGRRWRWGWERESYSSRMFEYQLVLFFMVELSAAVLKCHLSNSQSVHHASLIDPFGRLGLLLSRPNLIELTLRPSAAAAYPTSFLPREQGGRHFGPPPPGASRRQRLQATGTATKAATKAATRPTSIHSPLPPPPLHPPPSSRQN